jgi:hypothetical protein
MALGIIPGDPDSATKAFADLKTELDNEKAARKATQIEADMLAQAVKDLKILANKFATQILTLEDKVEYLKTWWWTSLMKLGPENSAWSALLKQTRTMRSRTLN